MGGVNIAERSSATFLLSPAGDSPPFSFGGMGGTPIIALAITSKRGKKWGKRGMPKRIYRCVSYDVYHKIVYTESDFYAFKNKNQK